jgi:transposase InsO family protein
VQYATVACRSTHAAHGLVASMSRQGNCYDNAVMEAFWSSLKNELVHRCRSLLVAAWKTWRRGMTGMGMVSRLGTRELENQSAGGRAQALA